MQTQQKRGTGAPPLRATAKRPGALYSVQRLDILSGSGKPKNTCERVWVTNADDRMGFFVRCMADMLDAGLLQIDRSTAFELPLDHSSSFYPSLRDMISLYATIQFSCTPLDVCSTMQPIFEMSPVGPEWVERFVGFSRRIIILLGRVHSLVVQRSNMLRSGGKDGSRGSQIEAQAQELLVQLNEGWDWEEGNLDVGRSDRIQRGNEVSGLTTSTRSVVIGIRFGMLWAFKKKADRPRL